MCGTIRNVSDHHLSPLQATAAALHEWFCALTTAGFTDDQALSMLVKSMVANRGEDDH